MPDTATRFPSPVGELILTASEHALTGVYFPTSRHGPPPRDARADGADNPHLIAARTQLSEYFAGTRTTFDIAVEATDSEFERHVWHLLRAITYRGTTRYGEKARIDGEAGSGPQCGTPCAPARRDARQRRPGGTAVRAR